MIRSKFIITAAVSAESCKRSAGSIAEIPMRLGHARLERDSAFLTHDCLIQATENVQHIAQRVIRLGMFWVEAQALAEVRFGHFQPVLCVQHHAQIEVCLGISGSLCQHLAQILFGCGELAK